MTPANLMTRIDGLMGSGLRAARAPQRVLLWRDCIRSVIFSQALRNATDWELGVDADVVNAGASGEIDSSGGTLYGILVDSIFDVSGEHLVVMATDSTDQTLDALDAGNAYDMGADVFPADSEGILLFKVAPAADANNAVFKGVVVPDGQVYGTNIQLMADGEEGTAPTANDVRAYVVYRSDTETQV